MKIRAAKVGIPGFRFKQNSQASCWLTDSSNPATNAGLFQAYGSCLGVVNDTFTKQGFLYFYNQNLLTQFNSVILTFHTTLFAQHATSVTGTLNVTFMLKGDLPDPTTITWNTPPSIPAANYTITIPVSIPAPTDPAFGSSTLSYTFQVVVPMASINLTGPNAGKALVGLAIYATRTSADGQIELTLDNATFYGLGAQQVMGVVGRSSVVDGANRRRNIYIALADYNTITAMVSANQLIWPSLTTVNAFVTGVGANYDDKNAGSPVNCTPFADGNGQGVWFDLPDTFLEPFTTSFGTLIIPR